MELTIEILQLSTALLPLLYLIFSKFKKEKMSNRSQIINTSKSTDITSITVHNEIQGNNNTSIIGSNIEVSNTTNNYNVNNHQHKNNKIQMPNDILVVVFSVIVALIFNRYIIAFNTFAYVIVMILITVFPINKKILWYIATILALLVNNFAVYWNPWIDNVNAVIKSTSPIGELMKLVIERSETLPYVFLMSVIPLFFTALYGYFIIKFIQYRIAIKRKINLKRHEDNLHDALIWSYILSIALIGLSILFAFLYS